MRTVAVYCGKLKGKFRNKKEPKNYPKTPVVKPTKKIKILHYCNQYDISLQEDKPISKLVKIKFKRLN